MSGDDELAENIQRWDYALQQKINQGDMSAIDSIYAPDYIFNGMNGLRVVGKKV